MDAVAPVARRGRGLPWRLLRLRSDVALAERFVQGDELAFAVLFERHRRSVLAVCMGVLASRPDAEDAAQEAFAALAVSLRQGQPENLRAWLTKVARNAAIDLARRRHNEARTDEEVPDRAVRPDALKAELESVLSGIRELPESQRTALLMRELAGQSYREIAALLEVDEEAVRGLIARARISLRSYREAAEMSCATARAALAAEPGGRRQDRTVRRHVRTCASCRAYQHALRDDARALHSLVPNPTVPIASGSAVCGGLAAKGMLISGVVTQLTAACAVSVCAVGGIVLLAPHPAPRRMIAPPASISAGRHGAEPGLLARYATGGNVRFVAPAASAAPPAARQRTGAAVARLTTRIDLRPEVPAALEPVSSPTRSSTPRSARYSRWRPRGYAAAGTAPGAGSLRQPLPRRRHWDGDPVPGDSGQPSGEDPGLGQTLAAGQPSGEAGGEPVGEAGRPGGDTGQAGGDTGQAGGDTGQAGGDSGRPGGAGQSFPARRLPGAARGQSDSGQSAEVGTGPSAGGRTESHSGSWPGMGAPAGTPRRRYSP
jgi:RNA polymerase sigma factor (sigma-70 family)